MKTSTTQRKTLLRGAVALIAAVAFAGSVFAQDKKGEEKKPDPRTNEVKFRKDSQLSAAEQLRQAQDYLTKLKAALKRVESLADKARKDKDLLKLNCVNRKKVALSGAVNVLETQIVELRRSKKPGDRNHLFAKATILYQKGTVDAQEAEACVGDEISYVGTTKVEVQVDPDVEGSDDGSKDVKDKSVGTVGRLPVASPFI